MNQLRSRTHAFKVFTGYRFHVLLDTSQIPQKQFKQVFWVLFLLDHLFSNAFACMGHAIVFFCRRSVSHYKEMPFEFGKNYFLRGHVCGESAILMNLDLIIYYFSNRKLIIWFLYFCKSRTTRNCSVFSSGWKSLIHDYQHSNLYYYYYFCYLFAFYRKLKLS